MGDFRKLAVWQKSYQLTLKVYQSTGSFPKEELFGVTSQMRRAAASIPANIAEGSGRGTDMELRRFCQIALGSANELEFFMMLSRDLGYLEIQPYEKLNMDILEVQRMLASLIQKLTTNS
ncbi:MAG: four helix bundle protein [Chloroflexota bacterium]|nr:four helix bundle protein [Chloroflexota bacterium]